MEHINKLTQAEAERLTLIIGQLGDVQKIIGNIFLYGYDVIPPGEKKTNREILTYQVALLQCSFGILIGSKDVSQTSMEKVMDDSMATVLGWLQFHADVVNDLVSGKTRNLQESFGKNVFQLFGLNGKKNEQRSTNH